MRGASSPLLDGGHDPPDDQSLRIDHEYVCSPVRVTVDQVRGVTLENESRSIVGPNGTTRRAIAEPSIDTSTQERPRPGIEIHEVDLTAPDRRLPAVIL